MNKPILIHNPRCSKSREAANILNQLGVPFETIDYLKDGLTEKLLLQLPILLGLSFKEMVREKEALYSELKLKDKNLSDKEWIDLLRENPILLERPIFIHNNKAIIGRPSELVKKLLS
jgi:arsenate reductase